MFAKLDPLRAGLQALSECESVEEFSQKYVPVPFSGHVVSKASRLGSAFSWVYSKFAGFVGTESSASDALLSRVRDALSLASSCEAGSSASLARSARVVGALWLNSKWRERLEKISTLLHGGSDYSAAACRTSATLFEDLIASATPYPVLGKIVASEQLTPSESRAVKRWTEDIVSRRSYLSSELWWAALEHWVRTVAPQIEPSERAHAMVALAWHLHSYHKGLFVSLSKEQESVDARKQLPIVFPKKFPIQAYVCDTDPNQMVLTASNRLFLGLWKQSLDRKSVIDYLRVESYKAGDRFAMVERLQQRLSHPRIWELVDEKELLEQLSLFVKDLIAQKRAFVLDGQDIWVTSRGLLRLLSPLKELDGQELMLIDVELFVHKVCRFDRARVRDVLERSGLFEHVQASVIRELMLRAKGSLIEGDIGSCVERVLRKYREPSKRLSKALERWLIQLREQAERVQEWAIEHDWQSKEQVFDIVVKKTAQLQKKLGFVYVLPEQLHEHIIGQ